MYYLLGACLTLAALLALHALASAAATLGWRAVRGRARNWTTHTRAQTVFALRVLPAAGVLLCVTALLLPAYVAFEPRHSQEKLGATLTALALVSILGVALAARRGLAAWLATRRLVADWLRCAEPVRHMGWSGLPVFSVRHPFPVVAVVGVLRPRLFIASHLFDALTAAELAAAVAHERAHLAACDNLKRVLLRACRDALSLIPCGRALDRAWAEEAERAADEHATRAGGTNVALDLASALVKVARLAPVGARPARLPAGSYILEETGGCVTDRVRRLVSLAGSGVAARDDAAMAPPPSNHFLWACLGAFLAALPLAATNQQLLVAVHEAIERIVFTLN